MKSALRTTLVTALVLSCAAAGVHAWTHAFEEDGIQGTLAKDGDNMTTECRVVVDRPPTTVLAVLSDYDHLGDWLPDTVEYRGERRAGLNGRFYRHSKAPFFMPKMWVIVDAVVTQEAAGHARVLWHRVEGSITAYDAQWDLSPAPGGTLVVYRVATSIPLPAPAFIIRRVAPDAIIGTLRGLRAATRTRTTP